MTYSFERIGPNGQIKKLVPTLRRWNVLQDALASRIKFHGNRPAIPLKFAKISPRSHTFSLRSRLSKQALTDWCVFNAGALEQKKRTDPDRLITWFQSNGQCRFT